MKIRFLLCLAILAKTIMVGFAQTDSLYSQQWNRDALTNFNFTNSAQRQIITKETIRNSGFTHVGELLILADAWTFAGYATSQENVQNNGTVSNTNQNWIVLLNGQRIEPDKQYLPDALNRLGIGVYDIERIEIINSTGMYLGEFVSHGLIHIITQKQSENGINVNAFVSSAAGYAFNSGILTSDFVLRDTRALSLGLKHNKFRANSSFVYNDWTGGSNSVDSRLELTYTGNKVTHQIQTQSLFPYQNSTYKLVGYLMLWNLNNRNQIRLSSTFNHNEWPNTLTQQLKNTLHHRYSKLTRKGNFVWQNGVGMDAISYSSSVTTGTGHETLLIKPYSSINIPVTRRANLFADAHLTINEGKTAPKATLGIYKRVSVISNYSFVLGYTETLWEEFLWNSSNLQLAPYEGGKQYYNPKLVTADLYYNLNIGNYAKLSFNSGIKQSEEVVPEIASDSMTSQWIERSTYQTHWVNRVNFHYDIIKNMVFDFNYMLTGQLKTWNDELQTIPKHKFTFVLQFNLPKRFTVWSRNSIQSQTTWLNPYAFYTFDQVMSYPSQFGWELGLNKKLFKEYLNINLSSRNIFPKADGYQGFLYLSISANIGGLGNKTTTQP